MQCLRLLFPELGYCKCVHWVLISLPHVLRIDTCEAVDSMHTCTPTSDVAATEGTSMICSHRLTWNPRINTENICCTNMKQAHEIFGIHPTLQWSKLVLHIKLRVLRASAHLPKPFAGRAATAGDLVWWERLVTLDLANTLELFSGLRGCRALAEEEASWIETDDALDCRLLPSGMSTYYMDVGQNPLTPRFFPDSL